MLTEKSTLFTTRVLDTYLELRICPVFHLSWLMIEKRLNDLWEQLINSQLKFSYPGLDETDARLRTTIKNRREKLEKLRCVHDPCKK